MYIIRQTKYSKDRPDLTYLEIKKIDKDYVLTRTAYKIVNIKKMFNQFLKEGIKIDSNWNSEGFSNLIAENFSSITESFNNTAEYTMAEILYRGIHTSGGTFNIKDKVALKGQKNILKLTFMNRALTQQLAYNCWQEMEKNPEEWGLKCL